MPPAHNNIGHFVPLQPVESTLSWKRPFRWSHPDSYAESANWDNGHPPKTYFRLLALGLLARHYSDITWVSCRHKSPAVRRFVQQLVQANNKEHIKEPANIKGHFPLLTLCEGTLVTDGFPQIGPVIRAAFPCYNVFIVFVRDG